MRKFLVLLIVVSLCLCSCGEAVSVNTGEADYLLSLGTEIRELLGIVL